jgi:hypothetical protein
MYIWKCPICEATISCNKEDIKEFTVYCDNCENETYSNELYFTDDKGNKLTREDLFE